MFGKVSHDRGTAGTGVNRHTFSTAEARQADSVYATILLSCAHAPHTKEQQGGEG